MCQIAGYSMKPMCTELMHYIYLQISPVVPQCFRRQAIAMEQGKIRLSVTLYSLDQSLPNMVGDPYWYSIPAEFSWVENSPQVGDMNETSLWFFVLSLFCGLTLRTDLHDQWIKTCEIRRRCAFWGFVKKFLPPPLLAPKFQKFCITKAVFHSKHV